MGVSSEVVQRARARVGTVLNGKWRLERMLGIGGMAAVYAAVHRNQNRVAIKMLHPELCIDDSVKVRFLREGYAANTVGHPGAVAVHDDDIAEDGSAFLVMELLQGETLEDRAARKNMRLPPGEVLQLADQLLEVLAAAHDQGIVHRDIKPDNLFLTTNGQLKVLDFGIARLLEWAGGKNDGATGVGTFMGTPAFMPPEQARGRWDEVDFRTDVWAVGATMYTLISGNNVHEAETVTDQLVLAATAPAPSLGLVVPGLPTPVVELVDRALAYEKIRRWPGVRSMQVALRDALPFVEPVLDVSAPRVSLSVLERDREAETLAAPSDPPEAISDIARGSRPTSLVSAVTSAPDRSMTSSKKRRRLGALAAAAVACVILVALVMMQSSPEPARVDLANIPTLAEPQTPSTRESERSASAAGPAPTEGARTATPVHVASPAKDAGASGNANVSVGRSSRRWRSAVRLDAQPALDPARPMASPAAPARPPPNHDPFEKRY